MKRTINAAYDREFYELLERLGLKAGLESGELVCGICRDRVEAQNIIGVYSEGEQIYVCCDKPSCTTRLAEKPPGSL